MRAMSCNRFNTFNSYVGILFCGKSIAREFPGSPMVRTWHLHCRSSIPGRGTKIPKAAWRSKKKKCLAHISIQLFVFVLLTYRSSVQILVISPLSVINITNNFFLFVLVCGMKDMLI